jgi:Kef-type K+ transport system membrane component KefB
MTTHQAMMLLLDLAVILLIARAMGAVAQRLGQPAVIGEIVAGIALGPTLLGGTADGLVFPQDVRPALTAIGDVGLAIFMFIVGLELDRNAIRRNFRTAMSVSFGSVLLPFGLGAGLAYLLIRHNPSHHSLAFVVFIGAAMSITSFPVMARILNDLTLHRIQFGALALTGAAACDVIAWTLLAVAIALATAGGHPWLVALAPVYVALMIGVVRPLLRRLIGGQWGAGTLLPVVVAGLLLSGVATEWLGLNFIFGAFLFGAIVPQDGAVQLRRDISEQLGRVSTLLLLPVFFVVAGLQVNLAHTGLAGLGLLGLILLVAITGKSVGAFAAARLLGKDMRQSAGLATLMNTRGVTELVVLAIGLQLRIIDRELYSYMVVMAVVTTAMAGPVLRRLYPRQLIEHELAAVLLLDSEDPVLTAQVPAGDLTERP